ncbi:MAG: chemotaxis protein CheW [candidate division WOR-3 bacterium]
MIGKSAYLICELGKEKIALPIWGIKEILWDIKVYPLPEVSAYIVGILAEEKKLAVVIDLAKFFNIKEENRGVFLKFKMDDKLVFIAVKDVEEILEVKEEEIYPCPPLFSSTVPNYYITGLIKKEEIFIPIIELTKIFEHQEIKPFISIGK